MASPTPPTKGRIVLVRLLDSDAATTNGQTTAPAIVVDDADETGCVCLRVFLSSEANPPLYRDVPYTADAAAADAPKPSWSWPPRA